MCIYSRGYYTTTLINFLYLLQLTVSSYVVLLLRVFSHISQVFRSTSQLKLFYIFRHLHHTSILHWNKSLHSMETESKVKMAEEKEKLHVV